MKPSQIPLLLMAALVTACSLPSQAPMAPSRAPDRATGEAAAGSDVNDFALLAVGSLPVQSLAVDSEQAGAPKALLTDGKLDTAWINGRAFAPTATATVDLGGLRAIASVQIKTGPSPAGTRYDVQLSADGTHFATVLANQTNAGWGLESKALAAGSRARGVRIVWHNRQPNPLAHLAIYELRVLGEATVQPPPATPTPMPTPTPAPIPLTSPPPPPAGGLPAAPGPQLPGFVPVPLVGLLPPPPGPIVAPPPVIDPPPPLPAATGSVLNLLALNSLVAQFRPVQGRLRIDVTSEVALGDAPTLDSLAEAALAQPPAIHLVGHAYVFFHGTTNPITAAPVLASNFIVAPGAAPGTVVGGGTNFMQLAWPRLNPKVPLGPPIVRVQLGTWDPQVGPGTMLDVVFDLESVDAAGNVLVQWNAPVSTVIVP